MNLQRLYETLSPNERKILPHLEERNISDLAKKSNTDKVSVLRALEFLENKKIVELKHETSKVVDLGINGILYKRKGLPERRLLNVLGHKKILMFKDAQKESHLSNEEFKAALGALKKKAFLEIQKGKLHLTASAEEVAKKTLEESFIEVLPVGYEKLLPEQNLALSSLQNRKGIVEVFDKKEIKIKITDLGKDLRKLKIDESDFIEQISPSILKSEKNWKGKKFRRYDISSPLPKITGGKRHFVNQALDHTRKLWTEMGFSEMTGQMVQGSFWNFDALFTAQDHPVREMQDTFFIDKQKEILEKDVLENVKQTHENGVDGSKGWGYVWEEEDAKKVCLRTHTTCLSAKKLYELSKLPIEERKGKFFALGKNFRNETVDWSHGFEFYQTEGIVIDENVTFRHLLGYLTQFYKKMGFEKIKFTPGYFPYTEPSVEAHVWHPEKKVWLELGGAGVFRPEISIPLLGKKTPILAWGQGFDRIIMDYYKIKDLRELYKNNLKKLREIKFWVKK